MGIARARPTSDARPISTPTPTCAHGESDHAAGQRGASVDPKTRHVSYDAAGGPNRRRPIQLPNQFHWLSGAKRLGLHCEGRLTA